MNKSWLKFIYGVMFGILVTLLACWLMVSRAQPQLHSAALTDPRITEAQLSANTYIYSVAHNAAELANADGDILLERMAGRAKENGATRFVMLKIDPKMFCSAVAAHPAANVLIMRPLDKNAPEIVELDGQSNKAAVMGVEL